LATIAHMSADDGSPPRVWGQQPPQDAIQIDRRFTPTCVGTTVPSGSPQAAPPVHPHVCGDNTDSEKKTALLIGSPPRVWGQR